VTAPIVSRQELISWDAAAIECQGAAAVGLHDEDPADALTLVFRAAIQDVVELNVSSAADTFKITASVTP